jgi:hypothetical protein
MSLQLNIGDGAPGRLLVSGGPLKSLLLDTHEATVLGFYDRFGDLHTVIYRVFSDDMWGMVNKNDEDWHSTLLQLGIRTTKALIIPTAEEVAVLAP